MANPATTLNSEPQKPTYELQKEFRLFKELTAAYGSSLGSRDYELKPRSLAGQERILSRLRMFNELLAGTVHVLGKNPGHFYLRLALKKFGWRIPNEVFDLLGENDTVEIYGPDMALRVANLRFAEVCSYSLDDVLDHEFYELFDRDASVAEKIMTGIQNLLSGQTKVISNDQPQMILGPDHVVAEKFSEERRRFWVESRFLAQVSDTSNNIVGFLYSARVNQLQTQTASN